MSRIFYLVGRNSYASPEVDRGRPWHPVSVKAVDCDLKLIGSLHTVVGTEIGDNRNSASHDKGTTICERFACRNHIDRARTRVRGRRNAHVDSGACGAVDNYRIDSQIGPAAGDVELGEVLLPVGTRAGYVEHHFLAFVAGIGRNLADDGWTLNDAESTIADDLRTGSGSLAR